MKWLKQGAKKIVIFGLGYLILRWLFGDYFDSMSSCERGIVCGFFIIGGILHQIIKEIEAIKNRLPSKEVDDDFEFS